MKQSQKLLLTWLIEDTGLFAKIKGLVSPKDFTEELYQRAAKEVFSQYEKTKSVNPAQIISLFPNEEDQKEIAALFNARIHKVETKADLEKVLKETIIRIKQNSIDEQTKNTNPVDLTAMMELIEAKRQLETLEKLHISID